ncbi:uncharacterized protein LACBIDRAFT_313965 [Laccaria bicolor S238N-H82]|uniref:Predicted protein n=1 Tax=Laccaria bicolor (strain S238N-H82 / ATCC MYA-4686) TaxID=486041 RepID=B0D193_LACBS|nr:uncharacterized protein LACBIDRAFT_313965 [Laccaria bicolor S238N-H82]EDR11594.1 predicted protein [Laccaria bicolor S238N-H82]|eukprot:XP_001877491.1 predicted protein [Laccaria bicolor S238N-H82]
MAPARSSTRRGHGAHDEIQLPPDQSFNNPNVNKELFIDPMLGTPLAVYIEKDVEDKATLVNLVTAHGGTVVTGYSGVTYILVDPHKSSGQNLYQQYALKKAKLVLDARWIHECIKANQLHTFQTNWAGCKVTGKEQVYQLQPTRNHDVAPMPEQQIQPMHTQSIPVIPTVEQMGSFPYPVYPPMHEAPRGMSNAPPQTWNASAGIAPSQTHINPPAIPQPTSYRPSQPSHQPQPQPLQYRHWDGYPHPQDGMSVQHPSYTHEFRYREEHTGWVQPQNAYFEHSYDSAFPQNSGYMDVPSPPSGDQHPTASTSLAPASASSSDAVAGPSTGIVDQPDKRGRKRTRAPAVPAVPAASLVVNRHPPARSPTPPTRVIKSTYGGNLFTADDIIYLKKYIDYCQDQGLVLSLREICERIAVKAPHHTFYSWRRYCNKHQIRLGGYTMNNERSESPGIDEDLVRHLEEEMEIEIQGDGAASSHPRMNAIPGQPINAAGVVAARPYNIALPQIQPPSVDNQVPPRRRSPTPPRALFRSTTGKGVAFTQEDVTFLIKYMDYRSSQGRLDMVAFWKDVATKAPHHSRASWMKFWRRHKHELNRTPTDEPLPAPPDKKMRYSREDDILLAKFFFNKPEGTLDKLFQAFGRLHPHHPWKGWQEHHRIHKAKIDHLIERLNAGESLDSPMEE